MKSVVSSLVLTGSFLALTQTSRADWPHVRGPQSDGTVANTVVTPWGSQGPKKLWKVPTPDGFSSFSVKDGRAFTLVTRNLEGIPREVCVALDANTGKELWSASFNPAKYNSDGGNDGTADNRGGDGPRSTPTLDGDKVYVLTADLVLGCLDAKTGKEIWKREIIKEHAGRNITWKNAASALVEGNLVFLAGGGAGESLIGIDKLTGKTVWKAHDEMMTHANPVPATIHGVRQVIFFTQSGLVSVAPKDGALLWKQAFKFNVSTASAPVVGGDIVYCAAGYSVGSAAFRVSHQAGKWSMEQLYRINGNKPVANHWSTPIYKDGHLYGMFGFKEYGTGPIKCVELATGKVKWEQAGFGPGNVIIAGNDIVALSDKGELVLIEATPSAYKEKSRADVLDGKCWSHPALSGGRLYVRSTKEGACFDVTASTASR